MARHMTFSMHRVPNDVTSLEASIMTLGLIDERMCSRHLVHHQLITRVSDYARAIKIDLSNSVALAPVLLDSQAMVKLVYTDDPRACVSKVHLALSDLIAFYDAGPVAALIDLVQTLQSESMEVLSRIGQDDTPSPTSPTSLTDPASPTSTDSTDPTGNNGSPSSLSDPGFEPLSTPENATTTTKQMVVTMHLDNPRLLLIEDPAKVHL